METIGTVLFLFLNKMLEGKKIVVKHSGKVGTHTYSHPSMKTTSTSTNPSCYTISPKHNSDPGIKNRLDALVKASKLPSKYMT